MKIQSTETDGFTMLELIVVIAILAIMAIFGGPALKDAYNSFSLRGEVRDLYSALQNAKLVAIKENAGVVVQFTPQAYTPDGGVGSYYIFIDDGAGGGTQDNGAQDGSEEILANVTMPSGISLFSSTFAGAPSSTAFNGRGLPDTLGSVQIRNADTWYKISVSTANINMQKSSDGVTWF